MTRQPVKSFSKMLRKDQFHESYFFLGALLDRASWNSVFPEGLLNFCFALIQVPLTLRLKTFIPESRRRVGQWR
jgi:hypothetical protein